jgi:hypothetical protein
MRTSILVSNPRRVWHGQGCVAILQGNTTQDALPTWALFAQVKGYPANPKTIGHAIRKRGLDLKLRQIDVVKIIGCHKLTVVHWERGHGTPRVNRLVSIVRFLVSIPNGGMVLLRVRNRFVF